MSPTNASVFRSRHVIPNPKVRVVNQVGGALPFLETMTVTDQGLVEPGPPTRIEVPGTRRARSRGATTDQIRLRKRVAVCLDM
mgnify:CR=1 FL=1